MAGNDDALAARNDVTTHDISSMPAESEPCMWGSATLVTLVSSTCITVTIITESVIAHRRAREICVAVGHRASSASTTRKRSQPSAARSPRRRSTARAAPCGETCAGPPLAPGPRAAPQAQALGERNRRVGGAVRDHEAAAQAAARRPRATARRSHPAHAREVRPAGASTSASSCAAGQREHRRRRRPEACLRALSCRRRDPRAAATTTAAAPSRSSGASTNPASSARSFQRLYGSGVCTYRRPSTRARRW